MLIMSVFVLWVKLNYIICAGVFVHLKFCGFDVFSLT